MKRNISIFCIIGLFVTAAANATTSIPIDMSSGRPVVGIQIDGKTTLKMILDTGASGSVIDAGVAGKLGLKVTGETLLGDPSGRNQRTAQQVVLPNVEVGGFQFGNLEAAALDLPKAFGHGHRPVDGVLSLRAFEGHLVTFDLGVGKMYLSQGHLDINRSHVVPYSSDELGIPQIQVLVGPLTVKAFVDTGNPGQLSLSRSIAKHLDLAGPLEVIGKGRTVSSTFEISAAPLAGTVKFAGNTIDNPTLNFDKLHRGTQANIGSKLLSQFVVTLDQRNKLIRFERGSSTKPNQIASVHTVD